MRVILATTSVLLALVLSGRSLAQSERHTLDIKPQPIKFALRDLGEQTGIQILFRAEDVAQESVTTPRISGEMSPQEALDRLLEKVPGLKYEWMNSHTVMISVKERAHAERTALLGETRLAQLNTAGPDKTGTSDNVGAALSSAPSSVPAVRVEEIVVTAQKRSERLSDVPIPVTAVSAVTLTETNQRRLEDYFSNIPGLALSPAPGASSEQMLAIRGISTGANTNPTVGVTVDDVPYGSSTNLLGSTLPDVDPSDLARVEVLRGPQGTLYGASSMGGLIKYVTVDPSTEALSGRVQAGISDVYHGAEPGYNASAAGNIPISDTIAFRLSGFTRQDAGYLDNPVLHINGVNEAQVYGGRFSALWRPSEIFSLKLSALYQDFKKDGSDQVTLPINGYSGPALGDLQQNYLPGIGASDIRSQAYSATFTARLGKVDLTAVSGYNVTKLNSSLDYTFALGAYALKNFQVRGAPVFNSATADKFTEEVRASIPIAESVEWLVGGFYTHEDSPYSQYIRAENPVTGAMVGAIGAISAPSTYKEYAAFTDVTFHFTDRFDVQLGGRESHIEQAAESVTESGLLYGGGAIVLPEIDSTANAFTYLLTPRFKVSPDLMVYARMASGYRAGGANSYNTDPAIQRAYSPDKTQNYELGVKGNLADHLLSFDMSLYYIDWKDLQINLVDPHNNLTYTTNGNRAKSEGVELALDTRPLEGLTISAWGTYDDAVLTAGMPAHSAVYGPAGSRLPYGTRFSGNLSLNQDFPITDGVEGFVAGTVSYVGNRMGTFIATPNREYFPEYTKVDLRAGTRWNAWTAALLVNNVTNKRGVLGGGLGTYPPYAFALLQPRTIGVNVAKSF